MGLAEGINSKSRCTKRYQTSHRLKSLGFSCYLSCPQLKMSLQLALTPEASSSRAGSKLAQSLSHQSVICKSGQHLLLPACHCLSPWRHHLQPQWPLSLCPKKFDWSSKNIQRAKSHKAVWNSKNEQNEISKITLKWKSKHFWHWEAANALNAPQRLAKDITSRPCSELFCPSK